MCGGENLNGNPPLNSAVLRTVNVGGTPCLCGGTHVQRSSEIGKVTVTGMKKKKKNVRVYYKVE